MQSILSQSLLEIKAHAKVLSDTEIAELRKTHSMRANAHRRTHLITDNEKRPKHLPAKSIKPLPEGMVIRATTLTLVPEIPKPEPTKIQSIKELSPPVEAPVVKEVTKTTPKKEFNLKKNIGPVSKIVSRELVYADTIIAKLYEMLTPEQKVLAGKRLILSNLSGSTVTRSEERREVIKAIT